MEGILEYFDQQVKGMFLGKGTWVKCFFVLSHGILVFTDPNDKTQIKGKLHMQVSKVLNEDRTYLDGEIRINSGLFDIRLRAENIRDKINWKNALA